MCSTCPQRRCVTAQHPLMEACWTHLPLLLLPWPPPLPPPPLTRSRPSPYRSPPSRRDACTTTSLCQGRPLDPLPPPLPPPSPPSLSPLAPQVASRPHPSSPGQSPSPLYTPPCSPHPPRSIRQPCTPIIPCSSHSPSLWSLNPLSESTQAIFSHLLCCILLFFQIGIRTAFFLSNEKEEILLVNI